MQTNRKKMLTQSGKKKRVGKEWRKEDDDSCSLIYEYNIDSWDNKIDIASAVCLWTIVVRPPISKKYFTESTQGREEIIVDRLPRFELMRLREMGK